GGRKGGAHHPPLLHPRQPPEGGPHARGGRFPPDPQASPPGGPSFPDPEPRTPPSPRELARLPLLGLVLGPGLTFGSFPPHEPEGQPQNDVPSGHPSVDCRGTEDGHPPPGAAIRQEADHRP